MIDSRTRASTQDTLATASASTHRRSTETALAGDRIGRYVVRRVLGRGGMGVVYAAWDPQLDREVALKIVVFAGRDEGVRDRVLAEARAMAALSHPNVVTIHDVGELPSEQADGGTRVYIAMELVSGVTLREWARGSERSWDKGLELLLQVARGVAAAHDAGVLHRDLKPANVLVGDDGRARVMDFGLAWVDDEAGTRDQARASSRTTGSRTSLVGAGTPGYMPPEQQRNETVDERADQFSFCATAFEVLTGTTAFDGATAMELMMAVEDGRLNDARANPALPARVRRALIRGLSVDPDARWPSMLALIEQLEGECRRSWVRPVVAGVSIGVVGLGAVWAKRAPDVDCAEAAATIDEVWGSVRREEVLGRLRAFDAPYAHAAAQRVGEALDAYVQAWSSSRERVCVSATARHVDDPATIDATMRCLRDSRRALAGLVAVLSAPDALVVQRAADLVDQLPPVERCDRADPAHAPLPPEDAERIEAARTELERATMLRRSGRYADAREIIDAVTSRAAQLGYAPLAIEATIERGRLLQALGSFDDAQSHYSGAYFEASSRGLDRLAASSALDLAYLLAARAKRIETANAWLEHGRVALARTPDPELEAHVPRIMAELMRAEGRYADALPQYRQSLSRLRALHGDGPQTIAVLTAIGETHTTLGQFDEGLEILQDVLAEQRARLGDDHPDVAAQLGRIGRNHGERGDPKRAVESFEAALEIQERALPADDPALVGTLSELGINLHRLGRLEEAERHHLRALAIAEAHFGEDHPSVARVLSDLAGVRTAQERFDDAAAALRRAIAIEEQVFGEDHPDPATSRGNLGIVLIAAGRPREAIVELEGALTVIERVVGDDHPAVGVALTQLARARQAAGDLAGAQADARRAVSIREKTQPDAPGTQESRRLLEQIVQARRTKDGSATAG